MLVTSGTSPLSISPTFSDSIQVHYNINSSCSPDFSTCRIQMSCTSCGPASSVSNNLCAGAIAVPSGSILNYALTDPVTPSFTLETTSTPQNSSTVYCGSAVGDDDDVWYSFTAPTSGQIVVRHGRLTPTQMLLNNSAPSFIGMGLHTSCSIASAISGCQLTSTASNQKTFTGLTAGTTYYLRMWSNLTAGFTSAPIYLFNSAVIPVELISFEAKAKNETNVLTWRTATERDVQTFDLQRSANGQTNWASFQQIKPNGNSNKENVYTATDNTPLSISYYRLRSIDLNGKEDVSRTVAVNQGKGALTLTNVYPMPTKGTMAIDFEATKTSAITLTLTDLTGRIVLQSQIDAAIGMNHKDLDMTRMATGSYILTITDGETTRTKYIVKIKN